MDPDRDATDTPTPFVTDASAPAGTEGADGAGAEPEVPASPLGYIGAVAAFTLPLLVTFPLAAPYWSGRVLAVTVLAGLTFPLLVAAVWRERSAATVAAAAFVAWAAIATAVAENVSLSFWGYFGFGTGFVFIAACAGLWALGRFCGDRRGRQLVELGLVGSMVLTALIAMAQAVFDLSRADIDQYLNRSHGFTGNPAYLGTFLAGGIWLALHRCERRPRDGFVVVFLVAVALQLSGSRAALAVAVLALVIVPLRWRLRAVGAGVVVAGFVFGALLAGIHSSDTGTSRAASSDGGITARTEMWMSASHAIADHPVFGAGPGRFQAATSRYRTLRFAHAEGVSQLYVEAHNVVVEYATTTGVPGAILFIAFVGLAVAGAGWRSALGGFAIGVFIVQLAEPQTLAISPLAFIALGVAAPSIEKPLGRAFGATMAAGAAVGSAAAIVLGIGFFALNQARLDFTAGWAQRATDLLPRWSQAPEQQARIALLDSRAKRRPELREVARRYREEAVRDDPAAPEPHLNLADLDLQLGRQQEAQAQLETVLTLDPWSGPALNGLGRLALARNDRQAAAGYFRRSLRLAPNQPTVRELLRQIESA